MADGCLKSIVPLSSVEGFIVVRRAPMLLGRRVETIISVTLCVEGRSVIAGHTAKRSVDGKTYVAQ